MAPVNVGLNRSIEAEFAGITDNAGLLAHTLRQFQSAGQKCTSSNVQKGFVATHATAFASRQNERCDFAHNAIIQPTTAELLADGAALTS